MKYEDTIKIESKFSNIYLYQYENGIIKRQRRLEIQNYFYIRKEDETNVKRFFDSNKFEYSIFDVNEKSIYHENLVKIIPNKYEFWKQRKLLWAKDIQTYEAKIDPYLKFLLQNNVEFTKNRKIGIIDIETDDSIDCDNVPKPITSICVYDYKINKYYIWAWHKNKPCIGKHDSERELNYYNDEKAMLKAFIKAFKEFNFDILTGWYCENFDFPYIINRLKKLSFDINELSNFSIIGEHEVECRKVVYNSGKNIFYENIIPGIDIIDMIPIMKKANCYSEQPASFSLNSTVNWYLKDEKKLEFGSGSWKDNFEGFIKYNIQDVRLVKLLIDKYELMTFIYIFHLNAAHGVPLKHIVHNSIVLLYKIKQLYPKIILPDSRDSFKLTKDNIIDLKEFDIKIKAAKVLTTEPGIHENVVSYDFSSLYPTIMRTFNISPDTLIDDGDIEINDIALGKCLVGEKKQFNDLDEKDKLYFIKKFNNKEKGIYSQICEDLMKNRIDFKNQMKEAEKQYGENSFQYKSWAYRSDTQKQQLNSLYGVGAFKRFELYNPFVSGAVTSIGRKLLNFIDSYCKEKKYTVILGDTDSLYVKIPKEMDEKKLNEELNIVIKNFVLKKWPNLEKKQCLNFEYEDTFKKFIIKSAKKKYFGITKNGKLCIKGFTPIQHSTPKKVKIILENIFKHLLEKTDIYEVKKELFGYKKEFKKYSVEEVGMELRLANNPENYDNKTPHAEAGKYANKYLGTNFKAGDIGRFIFVKNPGSKKYPLTEYVFLEENTKLPQEFIIDYNRMWKKLVIMPLKTLNELKELQIEKLVSENKNLEEFIK